MHNTIQQMIAPRPQYSLQEEVVLACHIIVDQKLDSGPFGNVSVRIPNTQEFWVNPAGITFDQLKADDILRVDLQGRILEGKHAQHPGEFIHRAIYQRRNDVNAIVHTHSDNTVMMSLLGCEIEPFTQLGAALFNDQGIYLGFSGPVRTVDEGVAIAQALENKAIVIAKNHGLFAVGSTLQAALWDMVVADSAAKIHVNAKQLGLHHANKLSPEHMKKSKIEVRDKQFLYMWESYLNKLIIA
jgi:ribulose-5-phosphate 4-epimerase/fuculose-1-phosphate aldolase